MNVRRNLADDVSAAFARACRERDFEVADHLLCALKIIARREDEPDRLERAYLEFAHTTWPQSTGTDRRSDHASAAVILLRPTRGT